MDFCEWMYRKRMLLLLLIVTRRRKHWSDFMQKILWSTLDWRRHFSRKCIFMYFHCFQLFLHYFLVLNRVSWIYLHFLCDKIVTNFYFMYIWSHETIQFNFYRSFYFHAWWNRNEVRNKICETQEFDRKVTNCLCSQAYRLNLAVLIIKNSLLHFTVVE